MHTGLPDKAANFICINETAQFVPVLNSGKETKDAQYLLCKLRSKVEQVLSIILQLFFLLPDERLPGTDVFLLFQMICLEQKRHITTVRWYLHCLRRTTQ